MSNQEYNLTQATDFLVSARRDYLERRMKDSELALALAYEYLSMLPPALRKTARENARLILAGEQK